MKLYLRFGEIPLTGKSLIHDNENIIGEEIGVSVYSCIKRKGRYCGVIPEFPTKTTYVTFSRFFFPDWCCGVEGPIYVVTGKKVGIGSDGEPLLKDVQIVEQLPDDYFSTKGKRKQLAKRCKKG